MMSPTECDPLIKRKRKLGDLPLAELPDPLRDFAVTKNGFLPENGPLKRLPDAYYAPWEDLIERLSALIENNTLRQKVDKLPVLSVEHLKTEAEWQRAFVILGFLTHGYIWGGDAPAQILPPPLTVPLLAVSSHLGMPPVATYAALNLWNFGTTSPSNNFADLDNLYSLHTFTGTRDESWFYSVSVAIETAGAELIPVMMNALEEVFCVMNKPYPVETNFEGYKKAIGMATSALRGLCKRLGELGALLVRMDEHCDPAIFYHRIRPFLAGSKNMASAGLPRGVFYKEGEGKGSWRKYRGGSNGQSSLIGFLDLVLGVEHRYSVYERGDLKPAQETHIEENEDKKQAFHDEVREYMPAPHRRFLEYLEDRYPGGMRTAVERLMGNYSGKSEKDVSNELEELWKAFQSAIKAMVDFRSHHLQMVARYIIIPSRQHRQCDGSKVNLATASSIQRSDQDKTELTGTGGTALLPFLKQSREETLQAGNLSIEVLQ